MKENLKKNVKGITLIALVVTIIVLLILVGIAINLTIGENGIITKSKQASEKWQEASKNEEQILSVYEEEIDKIESGDMWKLSLNTDKYSTNIIINVTSKYYVIANNLKEYKEKYILQGLGSNGIVETMDEFLLAIINNTSEKN